MIEQFKKDVDTGLSNCPKSLPSKYFYNKKGDALFEQIMELPEYYVTRAEHEIFQQKKQEILKSLGLQPEVPFELIELGAGNGLKTKELLKELLQQDCQFDFIPIDISQNALDKLEKEINQHLPSVSIKKKQGDYFNVLASLQATKRPKIVLFLGSNIGNMPDAVANTFINTLGQNLTTIDRLILGVDLIKPKTIVLPAYDDEQGVTKAFNLNLLTRVNSELGGHFDLHNFSHLAEYTEEDGIAKSFLVSTTEQLVAIDALEKSFFFQKGEKIATEISRKYNDAIMCEILKGSGLKIQCKFSDSQNYFADYILQKNE